MRRIRYQEIADELRQRVRSASAGSVLPSESELSTEFAASRVTVRRALETVRDEGLIAARQGFGWFVATEPVRQRLETLGTIEAQLEDSGKHAERRVLEFAFVTPPTHVRDLLDTDEVLRVKRLNLADGEPFAVVTVWCPAALGRRLSRDDVERKPFYELLDVELRGATQTIGADSRRATRRGAARRAGRHAGAALPAGHHRSDRATDPRERAPVPGPPHRVRGRDSARRAVDLADRLAPRRLIRARSIDPITSRPSGRSRRAAGAWRA